MLVWILLGLGAYILHFMTAATLLMQQIGVMTYMGPRDTLPDPSVYRARALKATQNAAETLPVFLTLGILALVIDGADQALAVLGAQIYVFARLVYLAVYMSGITVIRSVVFTVSAAGLAIMGYALF